jgi:hypothetical protein
VKEKGLLLKVTASFVSGDDGIRTHVPVARQLDFESSSLWPLRYVSNAYLLYYAFDRISNIFLPFLKEVKEKIMQFFRNSLQILKDTMQ